MPVPHGSKPQSTPGLEYFRPAVRHGIENWATLSVVQTASQWHITRALLARAHIECRMDEGIPMVVDGKGRSTASIALLVPDTDLARAVAILKASKAGKRWCPECGSIGVRNLPISWPWMAFSLLFLGIAPFAPPRFECEQCGHRWE